MRKLLKTKKDVAILIAIIVVAFLGIALVSNIISTRKSLAKIINNAKVEAEKALVSSGLAVYTKNVKQNDVHPRSSENLPENTTENQQEIGTIVAPKENWNIETVTAISVGNGDTVPVPIGFYYVGGNLNTGVIISDEEVDKYDGQTDKTTWEYTTNLKGNQFVWIPCTEEEYKKCEVWNGTTQTPSKLASSGWDKTTYTSELPQIRKYGGFYVARYEAGLAETIPEFTEMQQNTGVNQIYNKEGRPQSKAGVVPWMFIDWSTSQRNAKDMYNTNSVNSGLITGTQWDVMLKQIIKMEDLTELDLTESKNLGHYMNNIIEYKGRMSRGYYTNGYGYQAVFGEETEGQTDIWSSYNGELLTTGASAQTDKYNTYDVAGNLWEWTDESSLYKDRNGKETNIQYHVFRGGSYNCVSNTYPICYRNGTISVGVTDMTIGFRVVLYIR